MNVVICGASGLAGASLLEKLLSEPTIHRVISVGRRSLSIQNPKYQEVKISDLSDISRHSDELNGDIYFCCLGTTIKTAGNEENFRKVDYVAVIDFARVAQDHHAKKFVVISAMGANSQSTFFYNRVKGQMEEDLQAINLESLVVFRPALLRGNRKEIRLGEKFAVKALNFISPLLPQNIEKSISTSIDDLSDKMLKECWEPARKVKFVQPLDI